MRKKQIKVDEYCINENDKYVEIIKENLSKISDEKIRKLVSRLIDERNYLSNTIRIDPLTGLYNRRILNHIREFDAAVMIDIDDFKIINDAFGHDTGDIVIQRIGQIMKLNMRISDYVCRMGGDEFLIVFTDCDEYIVKSRIEKICKQVEETIKLFNISVTLSAGIAYNNDDSSIEEIITLADQALYNSKNNGKNCITLYSRKLSI